MNYVPSNVQVYKTNDYSQFKRVIGNRSVEEERVSKILTSIDKIGYIPVPIIVNEKMEVIDGQGRLEACKRRGYPINFIIVPNLKIEDCITMNIYVSKWGLMDYILSYAEVGNPSYQYIVDLYKNIEQKYGKKTTTTDILCAALFNTKKAPSNAIKSGRLNVTKSTYEDAYRCLDFTYSIIQYYKDNDVRLKCNNMSVLKRAIIFCYKCQYVDLDKLYTVLTQKGHLMQMWSNVESCLNEIDYIYNYNAKTKTMQFKRLYEDFGGSEISNYITPSTGFRPEKEVLETGIMEGDIEDE